MSERPPHIVRVDSGKYTFVNRLGSIAILRHNEPWHEQDEAGNALASIMAELDAARVVLAAVREAVKDGRVAMGGLRVAQELNAALAKHEALVSDAEPPSDWAK